ncbi:heavy metal-associated isoprenylated plant protein 16-like [Solanum lycopersicum]|uniref:HMA domain-containing protein n=1 Tax=Solanum lycopersicum TaxID=4081 RepID=A0A3Q7JTQ6_SOLLC|nr:uncharacterized protein LOC104644861 [Solanum lycopersicum]
MKKKIVIDIPVSSDRCISKAMQMAVTICGVTSVNVDKGKGHLIVIGEGVDSFALMKCIKRRFRCANIVSVEEVKPPNPEEEAKKKKEAEEKKKKEEEAKKKKECKEEKEKCCKSCCDCCPPCCPPSCPPYCPPNPPCVQYYPVCQPVYDNYNPSCSIF